MISRRFVKNLKRANGVTRGEGGGVNLGSLLRNFEEDRICHKEGSLQFLHGIKSCAVIIVDLEMSPRTELRET